MTLCFFNINGKSLRSFLLPLFLVAVLAGIASGQTQPRKPAVKKSNTSDHINIRWADEFIFNISGIDTLQKLTGNVELNQDTVFLFCDSATILNSTYMVAQGNFILQQGDSMTIFADSAEYNSLTKMAELFSNVSLVNGRQKLFTDRLTYDVNTKIATYLTGATMTDDTTFLSSTRGYFHAQTNEIFFGDSVVVVNPDFTLRSDTMKFNTASKIVSFVAPTLITQDTARIYTEDGFYDINQSFAEFTKNPQYLKNDQKAWARVMRYDGNLNEVTLLGDAHFEDSTSYATADLIRYNEKTEVTVLEGNAFIRDENRTITGEMVTYDARNETYATRGRSHIIDGDQVLDANEVDYDKEKELGIARGNVIWRDTSENLTVLSEFAEHSKKKNYLKASGGQFGRPLLIRLIDGDSLFISADTLLSVTPEHAKALNPGAANQQADSLLADSAEMVATDSVENKNVAGAPAPAKRPDAPVLTKTQQPESSTPQKLFTIPEQPEMAETDSAFVQTTGVLVDSAENAGALNLPPPAQPKKNTDKEERIILAFHDVRIYKSDLQAVCDSLSYSTLDSMFRLYRQPVIWSDTSQFTADSVRIQLANDQIERIFLRQNAFIINSPDEIFFNQIKGKHSTAFFDAGELSRVRVEGNAESVYYARDDEEAYIGVNKTICSEMTIHFGNNEVEGIRFYAQPTSTLFPMKKADHEGLKMPGFNWLEAIRPKSMQDLFTAKAERPTAIMPQPVSENVPVSDSETSAPEGK